MSNTSPISLRIASKTRCFETSGDSSYYYSNHLLSNLAFLKIASGLGQQLSWPSKPPLATPPIKQGSLFLAKANSNNNTSRLEPQINLKATPGKEWLLANFKLVDKLTHSQQFFHFKALGLLAKTLGQCGRFNSLYSYNGILQKPKISTYKKTEIFPTLVVQQTKLKTKNQKTFFSNFYTSSLSPAFPLVSWTYCFASRQNLTTSFNAKGSNFASQVLPVKELFQENTETFLNFQLKVLEKNKFPSLDFFSPLAKFNRASKSKSGRVLKKQSFFKLSAKASHTSIFLKAFKNSNLAYKESKNFFSSNTAVNLLSTTIQRKTLLPSFSKTNNKPTFKTAFGLPFYLSSLGFISHCQVLKSSLAVIPIISGSLQSNYLIANHSHVTKTTSSSGLGLVSASSKLYIARNHKHLTQYLFFRIPFQFAENFQRKIAKTVYLTAKLQGMQKLKKRAKAFYASVRWL